LSFVEFLTSYLIAANRRLPKIKRLHLEGASLLKIDAYLILYRDVSCSSKTNIDSVRICSLSNATNSSEAHS
jgi:hypothetical protein